MIKYSFRILQLTNDIDNVLIDFDNDQYDILSTFIESDVLCFQEIIFKAFFEALSLNKKSELSLNSCHVVIQEDKTLLESLIEEQNGCEVATKELFQIINNYLEYCKQRKNMQ